MLMAVIAIILTLILVVGIHEAGHALAARIFQVKIEKISIGFGKPLIQWRQSNGTEWIWGIWPLGGYVHLLNSRISPVAASEYPYCFDKKPIGVRLIILLAGVIANLLTAWLALVLVLYLGFNYKLPQIQAVQPDSVAARAGISPGGQIIAVDGRATPSWQEVGMQLVILWGKKDVPVIVKREDNQLLEEHHLDLSHIQFTGKERTLITSLGMSPNLAAPNRIMQAPSLLAAMQQVNGIIAHQIYFFMMILKQLIMRVIPFSILLGPLGLFAASIVSLTQGIVIFFYFIATLSLAVALVNLFPVPGLDGGSIMYLFLEKIRGKPLSVAMEILLYRFMIIIFSLLLVQLILNDFSRFAH